MTLNDTNRIYTWKEEPEKEDGYYFILKDTIHHQDYNVVLVKDTGDVMVNGAYINDVPHELAMAIGPRIDYFMAQRKACDEHCKKHEARKAEHKKVEEKKPEAKKEKKADDKKPAKKEDDKKKK